MSATLSPATVLSVNATRADSGNVGWQQVKISRSRSSAASPLWLDPCSTRTRCNFDCWFVRARTRSMARLRAAVVNHAAGRSGIPSTGHRREPR